MRATSLCLVLLVAGCSVDYPDRHIAQCEIEYRAAPERVQDEYLNLEQVYMWTCMSALDYQFDWNNQSCVKGGLKAPCYTSRQGLAYRFKRLFSDESR